MLPDSASTPGTTSRLSERRSAIIVLWVDGVEVGRAVPGTATTLDGRAWEMARAISNAAVDLALDEWGIWSEALDVAALYARRTHHRAFGGYVYGVVDCDRPRAGRPARALALARRLRAQARSQLRAADLRQP